jgi:hypothetical protein
VKRVALFDPLNPYSEADVAESSRKTFQGIGCAAGALAFPAPFLFGFPGGFGMVPVLIIIGLVFMFLAMAAKRRRDRIVWAVAHDRQAVAPTPSSDAKPLNLQPLDTTSVSSLTIAATPLAKPSSATDSEDKLTQRLNKAKRAGL